MQKKKNAISCHDNTTVPATADDDPLAATTIIGSGPGPDAVLSPAAAATTLVLLLLPGLAATSLTLAAALGRAGHLAPPRARPAPPLCTPPATAPVEHGRGEAFASMVASRPAGAMETWRSLVAVELERCLYIYTAGQTGAPRWVYKCVCQRGNVAGQACERVIHVHTIYGTMSHENVSLKFYVTMSEHDGYCV